MFTGIIEEIGRVDNIESVRKGLLLTVSAPGSAAELRVNDSVSINGVCQTVIRRHESSFVVEAVEETLKKTAFNFLHVHDNVNLELPMRLNERLGGHLVLGHVDTVGQIMNIEPRDDSWMFTVNIPEKFLHYVVPVGSIAIDGVSLTVAEMHENKIRVSIIPHTMENTIFKQYKVSDRVNLEFDILGKYIEQLLKKNEIKEKNVFSEQYLRESGY